MRKNVYNSVVKEVYDKETGEIAKVEVTKHQRIHLDSEPFYMTFINHTAPLFNLKSATAKAVLAYLCNHAEFNTGKISISSQDRVDICTELGIHKSSLSIALNELIEKQLISGQRGKYTINPQIF